MKRALIIGANGQDGSYLCELLLSKGYRVFGFARKESWLRENYLRHLNDRVEFFFGNVNEGGDLINALNWAKPNELYNLAAQSRPSESWSRATETLLVNGLAAVRIFEAMRKEFPDCRLYQASSSEMFGIAKLSPQNEETPFDPVNPYAASKIYAHQMAKMYRETYGLHISSGILFNHESERRPLAFVTQKIAYGAACASLGINQSTDINEWGRPIVQNGKLAIGNLNVERDWGYAPDYVEAMWLILQQKKPSDFIIGSGRPHSLRYLCEVAYNFVGLNWSDYVVTDSKFLRLSEPSRLVADASKALTELGWKPRVSFEEMINRMVQSQINRLQLVI